MTAILTEEQGIGVAALVADNRITGVAADIGKAQRFATMAREALCEIANLSNPSVRYDIAYNAAHDIGEALLAAFGYRTSSGTGQHAAVGLFLEAVCKGTDAADAAKRFDGLRNTRNQLRYAATPIGKAQADLAARTAASLLSHAQEILSLSDN